MHKPLQVLNLFNKYRYQYIKRNMRDILTTPLPLDQNDAIKMRVILWIMRLIVGLDLWTQEWLGTPPRGSLDARSGSGVTKKLQDLSVEFFIFHIFVSKIINPFHKLQVSKCEKLDLKICLKTFKKCAKTESFFYLILLRN